MDPKYSKLKERILWFDGYSGIESNNVLDFLLHHPKCNKICVNDAITSDIQQYNNNTLPEHRIALRLPTDNCDIPAMQWNVPSRYMSIDLADYVSQKLDITDVHYENKLRRIAKELAIFKQLGMEEILKVIIYIIDTFIANNVVWGVGRGSSVASYVLFLIGLHSVDSYQYDIPIEEFLQTEN